MELRLNVTDDLIERAQRGNRHKCAVAGALAEWAEDKGLMVRYIRVDRNQIRFTDVRNGMRYTFKTPRSVEKFVDDWDAGRPVKSFNPTVPDKNIIDVRAMEERSPNRVVAKVDHSAPKKVGVSVSNRLSSAPKKA